MHTTTDTSTDQQATNHEDDQVHTGAIDDTKRLKIWIQRSVNRTGKRRHGVIRAPTIHKTEK